MLPTSRLNMGVGQGVNGFLILAVESINAWLSVYWLRPKCGTSRKIISGSLTFHFKLSQCVDNPPKSEKNNHPIATKQGVHPLYKPYSK